MDPILRSRMESNAKSLGYLMANEPELYKAFSNVGFCDMEKLTDKGWIWGLSVMSYSLLFYPGSIIRLRKI